MRVSGWVQTSVSLLLPVASSHLWRHRMRESEHTLPQNMHVYLACWLISIFFTSLRRDAPYRVPYLPTTPTFFV